MNELVETVRRYLQSRTPRERWALIAVLAVAAFMGTQAWAIGPLETRLLEARLESQQLEVKRRPVRMPASRQASNTL